jgi:hypothetical protein
MIMAFLITFDSEYRAQAGLLGAGAPITLFKLKRAVFDTEKGQLFYN